MHGKVASTTTLENAIVILAVTLKAAIMILSALEAPEKRVPSGVVAERIIDSVPGGSDAVRLALDLAEPSDAELIIIVIRLFFNLIQTTRPCFFLLLLLPLPLHARRHAQ